MKTFLFWLDRSWKNRWKNEFCQAIRRFSPLASPFAVPSFICERKWRRKPPKGGLLYAEVKNDICAIFRLSSHSMQEKENRRKLSGNKEKWNYSLGNVLQTAKVRIKMDVVRLEINFVSQFLTQLRLWVRLGFTSAFYGSPCSLSGSKRKQYLTTNVMERVIDPY